MCLITCPWYAVTQKERGESAKHNYLYIVYQSSTEQFVSPVNAHLSDQTNVIDKVCLCRFPRILYSSHGKELAVFES